MKTFLMLLCVALVAGCGMPDIRIKRRVTLSEIVGTWHLDPKSTALVAGQGISHYDLDATKAHRIIFRPDGTCGLHSVLQLATRYVDAEGKWKIVPTPDDPRGSQIQMDLKTDGTSFSFLFDLKEERGQIVIWEYWGDPDSCRFLEYNREAGHVVTPNGP